jgi:hypothetical protein
MARNSPQWLLQQLPDRIADSSAMEMTENVLSFRRDLSSSVNEGAAVLELVNQAAALIKCMENRAADIEVQAQALGKPALEKLDLPQCQARSAEAELQAAQAAVIKTNAGAQAVESAARQAVTRVAAAEAQLTAAELRANATEMRAAEREKTLVRVDDAIRTHLLGQRPETSSKLAAAA